MAPAAGPCAATLLAQAVDGEVHDVWAWNLDVEFASLINAATGDAAGGVILAFDVEFPGFLRQEPRTGARSVRYQVLRKNVDDLEPIQVGVALAGQDGCLRGVWNFNLRFDVQVDRHSAKSVAFLRAAGINFPRHAVDGIDGAELGQLLAQSELVGDHARAPYWVTFAGFYDFGYLLKLLTREKLPQNFGGFDDTLQWFCPRRHELRDKLPFGSLDSLARKCGLQRRGLAHTAGSDALLTLELFLTVVGTEPEKAAESGEAWWDCTGVMHAEDLSGMHLEEGWETMWHQDLSAVQTPWMSWEFESWEGHEAAHWDFMTPQHMQVMVPTMPLLPR